MAGLLDNALSKTQNTKSFEEDLRETRLCKNNALSDRALFGQGEYILEPSEKFSTH